MYVLRLLQLPPSPRAPTWTPACPLTRLLAVVAVSAATQCSVVVRHFCVTFVSSKKERRSQSTDYHYYDSLCHLGSSALCRTSGWRSRERRSATRITAGHPPPLPAPFVEVATPRRAYDVDYERDSEHSERQRESDRAKGEVWQKKSKAKKIQSDNKGA